MQRQSNFIFKTLISIRIILNIEAKIFISSHHRQRLVMHVGSNACFRHLDNDFLTLLQPCTRNTRNIQMARGLMLIVIVVKHFNTKRLEGCIIFCNNLLTSSQHCRITLHLCQTNGCHDIRHVAFEPWADDIIFPSTQLRFSQGILRLTMQRQQLQLMVNLFIINARNSFPSQRTALSSSKILYCMEAEGAEIRNRAAHLAMPACAEGMCCICTNGNSANSLLNFIFRLEQRLFLFYDSKNLVIIAGNTAKVYRNNSLRLVRNSCFHFVVVHLQAAFLHVHENNLCAHMVDNRSGCRIGVSRNDNLITCANAQDTQCHLTARSLAVQAYAAINANILCNLSFQLLSFRTSGNPAAFYSVCNLLNLKLAHIRGRKRNIHCFHVYIAFFQKYI